MIHDGYEVVSVSPVSTFVKQKSETEGTLSPSPCCKLLLLSWELSSSLTVLYPKQDNISESNMNLNFTLY